MRLHSIPRFAAGAILCALTLLAAGMARAQGASSTPDDLARQADVVAIGHVASLEPQWNADRTRIQTAVTIAVADFVKGGGSGLTLTVTVPGGEVDGVGEMYSDTPVFHRDEDVVVFARRTPQGLYRVAGGLEGKYSIARDAVTGKLMVSSRLSVEEFASQIRKAVDTNALKQ